MIVDPGGAASLARLARLLADDTRATFCVALLDGRAWTASELAGVARVAASTATEHLNQLVAAGLLVEERQGRHRYLRLAGPDVAHLIEDLAAQAGPSALAARPSGSLRAVTASAALARGRTCYDHLAGRLGVSITDALTRRGLLAQEAGFALTPAGVSWLSGLLQVSPGEVASGRRPVARGCLDWTERRPHLAGTAGARLCAHLLERRWVTRIGTGRAVRVTPSGAAWLESELSVDTAPLV
jgi:DNA-binding transcriptional ArsR family regulator